MTEDRDNPPPGVAQVGLSPIVVPAPAEGDEPGYNGFAPDIVEPPKWQANPILASIIDALDRPDVLDPRPGGTSWKAVRVLGRGGFGTALLWVRVDAMGAVQGVNCGIPEH